MNAVILGARGQLGQELARQLPGAAALGRADVDITDVAALKAALERHRPDVVFNAVSNNRVDAAQGDPSPAIAVNSLAVGSLAQICRELRCRLVHFSTNYVFGQDQDRTTFYREDDLPAPINAYGVSKMIGEELARSFAADCLIIRTAALFGVSKTSRHNFLENMLAKARSGDVVRVVNDQTMAPTSTADLARAAIELAAANATGVFHVNGSSETTWYELARRFFQLAGVEGRLTPVSTAELGAPAPRPRYSVLSNGKFLAMGFATPRGWEHSVDEYWRERATNGTEPGA